MAIDRQHAHRLLDQLPPGQLAAIIQLLEAIIAPDGNDAISPAERAALREADAWLEGNDPIPHEQVLSELGVTMADWDRMAGEPPSDEPTGRR